MTKTPPPPPHLKAPGKALWKAILSEYDVGDAHDLARLQVAAECADRGAEARDAIERDGAYTEGKFGLKAHPALAVEQAARILLLRAIREMGVDVAEAQPTRPPTRWRGK